MKEGFGCCNRYKRDKRYRLFPIVEKKPTDAIRGLFSGMGLARGW